MKDHHTEVLQCRASPELVEALDKIAKTRFNGTRSAVIREAIRCYVDSFETARCAVDDPVREGIRYLHEVLLQRAGVDALIKNEVNKLWQTIQEP